MNSIPRQRESGSAMFASLIATVTLLEAYMYAENDFYDRNLDAAGSVNVIVNGTMATGNKVDIERNFGTNHSKLELNFDSRLKDGTLSMPGLPGVEETLAYSVAGWIETSPYN